jgi:hypothetical protein
MERPQPAAVYGAPLIVGAQAPTSHEQLTT